MKRGLEVEFRFLDIYVFMYRAVYEFEYLIIIVKSYFVDISIVNRVEIMIMVRKVYFLFIGNGERMEDNNSKLRNNLFVWKFIKLIEESDEKF